MSVTNKTYKDIDLAFKPHPVTGDILKKFDDNDVKQSVRNLIKTNFYERLNVRLGGNLTRMLFKLDSTVTRLHINKVIRDVLEYEPRLEVITLEVFPFETNKYKVFLLGTIINTNKEIELETIIELL